MPPSLPQLVADLFSFYGVGVGIGFVVLALLLVVREWESAGRDFDERN